METRRRMKPGAGPQMALACLVQAVGGPTAVAPRLEELELDPGELGSDRPKRFLEACGLPAEEIVPTLSDAQLVASAAGVAVLTVTIHDGAVTAGATAPASAAPATT